MTETTSKPAAAAQAQRDPFYLAGKTAVVTGGASGIGAGIATTLAEAGAAVVVVDIDSKAIRQQLEQMQSAGLDASACEADLADEASIVRTCNDIISRHGTPWILVNNAGLQDRQSFLEGTALEWDRMNAVNARGYQCRRARCRWTSEAAGTSGYM